MISRLTITGLAVTAGFILSFTAAAAQGLVLRNDVIVYKDVTTVGDFFDNAGVHADKPLFRSPDLGHRGSVQISQIMGRMAELGLTDIESRNVRAVEVTRASQYLTGSDFLEMTKSAIAERLGSTALKNIEIRADSPPEAIHADAGANDPVSLRRLTFSSRSGRFRAQFSVNTGTRRQEVTFRGTAREIRRAVVLSRPIGRGELISAGDVIEARLNARDITEQSAVNREQLIGMEAKRNLRDNSPVNVSDVKQPTLVERNQAVTIVYKSRSMLLSSQGRALTAGAKGDMISIVNLQSNRTIQGRVVSSGKVVVTLRMLRLATAKE